MAITRPTNSVETNFSNTTQTTVSVNKPADLTAGDVILWCITVQNNQVLNDITDFTTIKKANGTALGSIVAYKVATGSEGATFTHTISSARYASSIVILRGVDTTNVLDVTTPDPITEHDVGTDTPVMPEITTVTDGAMVVGVPAECMSSGAGGVDFTGTNCDEMVGEVTSNNGSGSNTGCVFLLETVATAGAFTPTVTCAVDPARNEGYTFALRPAAAGGDTHNVTPTDDTGVTDTALVTEQKGKTDSIGVTDTVAKTQEKDRTDDVGVTDSRLISLAKRFTDAIGITDEASITKFKLSTETPTDSVDVTEQLELTYQKGFYDFLVNTDQIHLEQSKTRTSDVGITDEVTIIKSKSKTLEFLVGITDSIAITIKKTFNNLVGITDETSGIEPSEEAEPMSLVDEKRIVIGTVLGITEPTLSALSINDLLHMYWAADFPALHTYDGSESGLTPAEAFSTMDHHSRVEANEATDLDWIRGVLV